MRNCDKKFTNLVFKGGGAKGCAYAGCIQVLVEQGLYKNVKNVGGTSAGAITAALLAVGSGSEGLMQSVKHTDFRNFVSDSWGVIGDVDRLIKGYGLHTGEGFVTVIKKYFEQFCGNANITFAELEVLTLKNPETFKQLSVIASNITKNRSEIFNASNTPNLPIWQAVRASMSIPLVFEPMKIGNSYYVDGGLAWNYPIDLYDQDLSGIINNGATPVRNYNTLGFYLEPQAEFSNEVTFDEKNVDITSIGSFSSALISFMYQAANFRYVHPDDVSRTVFIDDLGVSATDFSIPDNIVDNLIDCGKQATERYLEDKLYTDSVNNTNKFDVASPRLM